MEATCEVRVTRRYDDARRGLGGTDRARPERLLELDWAVPGDEPSVVRFELIPRGSGTELVLDHRRINARIGMAYMERWTGTLERLDSILARTGVAR